MDLETVMRHGAGIDLETVLRQSLQGLQVMRDQLGSARQDVWEGI